MAGFAREAEMTAHPTDAASPFTNDELADPVIGGAIPPRARATIDALRRELKRLEVSHEHTKYWYSGRIRRIEDLAKEHSIWPKVAEIIANGSILGDELNYQRRYNQMEYRAKTAETERDQWKARAEAAEANQRTPGSEETCGTCGRDPTEWLGCTYSTCDIKRFAK